jgi:hypothetical protein
MVDAGLTGFELRRVRHRARYDDDPIPLEETESGRKVLAKAEAEGVAQFTGKFDIWINRQENRPLWDQAATEYVQLRARNRRSYGKPAPVWYQPIPESAIAVVPPTRAGIDPFDDDEKGEYRCPNGDTLGLNLLSELHVSKDQYEAAQGDLFETVQYFGVRRGLLRPERRLLISQAFFKVLIDSQAKGYRVEIARLV